MFGKIFATLGGVAGRALGGGVFTTIGRFAGRMLGRYLDETSYEAEEHYSAQTLRENLFHITQTAGKTIALVFGRSKVYGQVIWAQPIIFDKIDHKFTRYFEFSAAPRSITHRVEYQYYISFAVAICQGKIDGIERVWADEKLINLQHYKCRIYHGSEEQTPDPLIAIEQGHGCTPAFRGLAYIVFERLPLQDFGGMVPKLSFEVLRRPGGEGRGLESKIKALNIVPGSGEFVYDTELVYKQLFLNSQQVRTTAINCNNHENIADSVYNFKQLTESCTALQWAAPVICWYGDSLNIAECSITPRVEYNDDASDSSIPWQVAGHKRRDALLVSRDEYGTPNYGGTVNDASLIRYIKFLRRNNMKIMLYPMFLMDMPGKPWRGHLTGEISAVGDFFHRADGYRNFILHYARIVRGLVDAFIIGSEFVGLTKIHEAGYFPAVDELCALAQEVKNILGEEVSITYAADWSEYHHTGEGWYHLDKLWASSAIDYVGIDAYFPLTDTCNGEITSGMISEGYQSGEGYEYYYNHAEEKRKLPPEYAWKNIEYWWKNKHINPDGQQSAWVPSSKKIWFTECGFPSIDKATNQPNIFWDPKCNDGGVPKYSSGEVDFTIQRKALQSSIDFWQAQEYIERIFIWCWDVRPYPAWPRGNIWSDGYLWQKGHWLNHKLSVCSLADVITELAIASGISADIVDVEDLYIPMHGLRFTHQQSFWQAIDMLRCCYFFDIKTHADCVVFVRRHSRGSDARQISFDEAILLENQEFYKYILHDTESITNGLRVQYVDYSADYNQHVIASHTGDRRTIYDTHITLPISMLRGEVESIADSILRYSLRENYTITFKLPLCYMALDVTTVILYCLGGEELALRITDVRLQDQQLLYTAVAGDAPLMIPTYGRDEFTNITPVQVSPIEFEIIFLPVLGQYIPHSMRELYILYSSEEEDSIIVTLYGERQKVARHHAKSHIGTVIGLDLNHDANNYVIDRSSQIVIYSEFNFTEFDVEDIDRGKNLLLWGKEIIRYYKCDTLAPSQYLLSELVRGECGTESYINNHVLGERVVLINSLDSFMVSHELAGIGFQCMPQTYPDLCKLVNLPEESHYRPLVPIIDDYIINSEGQLILKLRYRNRCLDDFIRRYETEYTKIIIRCNDIASTVIEIAADHHPIHIALSQCEFDDNIELTIYAECAAQLCSERAIINI